MKILMLIDTLDIGGAETHTITLAKKISEFGHKVEVASAGGELVYKLKKVGIKHIKIPNIRRKVWLDDYFLPKRVLGARSIILHHIRLNRPDVVHAHTRRMAFLASGICRSEKIPLITTAHARFSMNVFKKTLSCWGDGTIAVSDDIKKHLAESSDIPSQKIKVIFNGIDIPD